MGEMDQKQLLVRCIRMLERSGIMDYNGHASIRVGPDGDGPDGNGMGRMLINIGACQRSNLTVEDICTIDFDGKVLAGSGKPPLEFHLHAGIYKRRPDVQAVIHAHPNWSTVLTTAGVPYLPVYAQGSLLHPMPILDSPNSINNPTMAKQLTDTLGNRPAALMKAHGAVTTGKSLIDAFVLMTYLEDNAQRQYMAAQIGQPYTFNDQELTLCREKLWNDSLFKRTWDHFSAKLDGH